MKFAKQFIEKAKEVLSPEYPEEKVILDIIESGSEPENVFIMEKVSLRLDTLRNSLLKPEAVLELLGEGKEAEVSRRAKKCIALVKLRDLYFDLHRHQYRGGEEYG